MHFYPEIMLHIAAGSLALLIGLIPMLSRKGQATHRRFGRPFVILATSVMLSAILSIFWRDKPSFVSLSRITLASTYLLWGACRALQCRRAGPKLIDTAVAIIAAVIGLRLFFMEVPHSSIPVAVANFSLYWLWCVVGYDLSRLMWRQTWCERAAPIDHGVKMIAVYFAMLSAGAGNLLPFWQPWSALIPNIIGMLCMTGMALYYAHHKRKLSLSL